VNRKSDAAFHDFEQAGWQRAAGFYADTFGTLTVQTIEPLLDSARVGSSMRVLDVATGPGYVAGAAAARGAAVTGIDFSSSMIEEARRRYPTVIFQEGDAEALSFDDGAFDAVVMNFGLLHLARPEDAICEAHRVLASGGRYAFTVWGKPEEAFGFGAVLQAMETYGTLEVGLPVGPPFFRFSDPDECRRTLAQARFAQIGVERLPLIWRLPSADALFEAALRGGVRTSAALQAQTPQALVKIQQAVREALIPYVDGNALAIPMMVVLAWGTRP
jgi:ubiquinone/menaquinone biosynthesis C-methylase UbiE